MKHFFGGNIFDYEMTIIEVTFYVVIKDFVMDHYNNIQILKNRYRNLIKYMVIKDDFDYNIDRVTFPFQIKLLNCKSFFLIHFYLIIHSNNL